MLKEGTKAPAFTLPDKDGNEVSLQDFLGHKVVVYFYPKDSTPGCTRQACGFRDAYADYERLGVPVIGIGVPTVVDAATIVNDTMENFIRALESSESLKGVGEVLRSYNAGEKYEFVKELIAPHLNGMFMTPKDVDEMIHHISHTISEALNMLFVNRVSTQES